MTCSDYRVCPTPHEFHPRCQSCTQMRFPIGTRFIKVGRANKSVWIVVDYHITTNMAGEIVNTRYVAENEFLGQAITDSDVCETTIARGLLAVT